MNPYVLYKCEWLNVYVRKATTSEMNSTDNGFDSSSWVDILKDNRVLCVTGKQLLSCGCFMKIVWDIIIRLVDLSLRILTPAKQVQTPPLEGPRILTDRWTCFSPTAPNRRFSSGSPYSPWARVSCHRGDEPASWGQGVFSSQISWDFFEVYRIAP